MSPEVVAKTWPFLYVLLCCSAKTYRTILSDKKLWKPILQSLVEIAFNYLYEEVGLFETERKFLRKHQRFLEQLAAKGGCKSHKVLNRKRKLILTRPIETKAVLTPLRAGGSLNYLITRETGSEHEPAV